MNRMGERIPRLLRKRMTWLILVAMIGGVYYGLTFQNRRIGHLIDTAIGRFEAEDIAGAMKTISERYHDSYGYTRQDIEQMATEAAAELDRIGVMVISLTIDRTGNTAVADLEYIALASYENVRGFVMGTPQDHAHLTIRLRKEPDGWRICSLDPGLKWKKNR